MSNIVRAKQKLTRINLATLWGETDTVIKRNYRPGEQGPLTTQKQLSDFGIQLRAKQRLKRHYGQVSEKAFHKLYKLAVKMRGDTSEQLIGLLERRLSIIVYRLNFAPTVFAARQLVNHKHIKVNGQVVNIPSYQVKDGDVIELTKTGREIPIALESLQKLNREVPPYLELDAKNAKGKLIRVASFSEVPYPCVMEPHLVIEFYSR